MSTDGEVVNALVCKTSTHGFKSHSVLQKIWPGSNSLRNGTICKSVNCRLLLHLARLTIKLQECFNHQDLNV